MHVLRRKLAKELRLEEGLTLIEVLAALTVLTIVMLALAASMISGYSNLRTAKQFQHATAIGNQGIESARDLDYEKLAMVDADLDPATDPQILSSCPGHGAGKFFDPDGSGSLECERLVYSATGGGINDHEVTRTVDGENYTVKRYVTWVDANGDGMDEDYKRVVTIVEWTTGGTTRNFRASTLVYAASKGIPVVRFELLPEDQSLVALRDEQVTFVHTITNLGFPDSFDLAMPNPAERNWTKTFYNDVNNNGLYEAGTDIALGDTNGNGIPDTGTLTTDQRMQVLTVFSLGRFEAPGDVTMILTVTPRSQPSAAKTATNNLTITWTPPLIKLYLHNNPSPPVGNTNATKNLPMDVFAPTATTLFNYAQNVYASPGRMTQEVSPAAHTESNAARMVNWVWQVPSQTTIEGDAFLHLNFEVIPRYVGTPPRPQCPQGNWDVYVRRKTAWNTDTGTLVATERNNDNGCGKQWLDETFRIPRTTLNANEWLEVKVVADNTQADGAIWAYDTTVYDSYVTFPQVVAAPGS